MLPGSLLTEYTDRFFGFGTWSTRVWFIGIEEAGGWSEEDVRKRLVKRGESVVLIPDAVNFSPRIPCSRSENDA